MICSVRVRNESLRYMKSDLIEKHSFFSMPHISDSPTRPKYAVDFVSSLYSNSFFSDFIVLVFDQGLSQKILYFQLMD